MDLTQQLPGSKVGFTIDEFCRGLGVSQASFYRLRGENAPRQVKIGSLRRVLESPAEYLARLEVLQTAKAAA